MNQPSNLWKLLETLRGWRLSHGEDRRWWRGRVLRMVLAIRRDGRLARKNYHSAGVFR